MVSRHIKKLSNVLPWKCFPTSDYVTLPWWKIALPVRGLSNSLSWKRLLTYISGSTLTGLLYDWVSSSDIWTLKAICNYISIHFWINSILKSEGFTISWNINLFFFTLVELTFLETPKTECCAYFFQVAKLVILDDCVMKNAVFQIMVCDVSLNVTVLKRTATISMDVETFLQVHIFEFKMR